MLLWQVEPQFITNKIIFVMILLAGMPMKGIRGGAITIGVNIILVASVHTASKLIMVANPKMSALQELERCSCVLNYGYIVNKLSLSVYKMKYCFPLTL